MSRAERRREERETNKLTKWLNGLNMAQKRLLVDYCREKSKEDLLVYSQAMERVLRPYIYEHSMDELVGEQTYDNLLNQIALEGETILKLNFKGESYMKLIEQATPEIINMFEDLKSKGCSEKEILEEVKTKFPKLTANAVKNAIAEHKRELRKKNKELNSNTDSDSLAAYILGEKEQEEPKEVQPVEESKEKPVEEPKEESKIANPFKILNKTVIVDVAGAHGEYHIENGKVKRKNEDIVYNSKEQVTSELNKVKEGLLKAIQEEEEKAAEVITLMEMYS